MVVSRGVVLSSSRIFAFRYVSKIAAFAIANFQDLVTKPSNGVELDQATAYLTDFNMTLQHHSEKS